MPRIKTQQPAVARPVGIYYAGLPAVFTELISPPDYSVPDPNENWPDTRDPNDDKRRIVPGMVMLEAPLLFFNQHDAAVNLELRILLEDSRSVMQLTVPIPALDTYQHPCPGQRLLKMQIATGKGDVLQARASVPNVVHVTGAGSIGSAEQDQPEQQGFLP
jgi:hypothetical protein